jgi:regulatory protein YycI of two-component signal transduction system YycFG
MKLLAKTRQLPIEKRKRIFWSVLIIVAIILLIFYINSVTHNIEELGKSNPSEELKTNELKRNIIKLFENR